MAEHETTVVKSGSSGIGLALVAIAILIAAAVGYMFLNNDTRETEAVSGAAESVSQAADKVGDAVTPSKAE